MNWEGNISTRVNLGGKAWVSDCRNEPPYKLDGTITEYASLQVSLPYVICLSNDNNSLSQPRVNQDIKH